MGSLGAPELMIMLVVVVLLFGSTKLPQLARSLGEAKNEFKKAERETPNEHEAV
jgi:sec-independent protein translocase protein TatA